MAAGKFLLLLSVMFILAWSHVNGLQRTVLPNLRNFRERGIYGRFKVPRAPIVEDFQRRKGEDLVCGNDVRLDLPGSNQSDYEPNEAEVHIVFFEIDDYTLSRELSCELKDQFAVSYKGVAIQTPFVSGSHHGVVINAAFYYPKEVAHPYPTNMNVMERLDRIEETDEQLSFYKGDDVMVLTIHRDSECSKKTDQDIKEDMTELVGQVFHVTSYPLPFDFWKCDNLGWNISFCKVLKEHKCELQRVKNDVCTQANITHAHYCPASMTVVNATGQFQDALSFVPSLPLVSFTGDYYDKYHSNGIVYPCLTA